MTNKIQSMHNVFYYPCTYTNFTR